MSKLLLRTRNLLHYIHDPAHNWIAVISMIYLLFYVSDQVFGNHFSQKLHPVIGFLHNAIAIVTILILTSGWLVKRSIRNMDIVGLARPLNGREYTKLFGKSGAWNNVPAKCFLRLNVKSELTTGQEAFIDKIASISHDRLGESLGLNPKSLPIIYRRWCDANRNAILGIRRACDGNPIQNLIGFSIMLPLSKTGYDLVRTKRGANLSLHAGQILPHDSSEPPTAILIDMLASKSDLYYNSPRWLGMALLAHIGMMYRNNTSPLPTIIVEPSNYKIEEILWDIGFCVSRYTESDKHTYMTLDLNRTQLLPLTQLAAVKVLNNGIDYYRNKTANIDRLE